MPDPRSSIVFKPGVVSAQLVYTAVGIHQYGFRHHQYCSKYTIQRGGDASSVELHVSLRSESFSLRSIQYMYLPYTTATVLRSR